MKAHKDIIGVYDANCVGDRYSVVLCRRNWIANPGKNVCLGFNENPEHQAFGISMFSECQKGAHLGNKIAFESLPIHLQKHVINRIS